MAACYWTGKQGKRLFPNLGPQLSRPSMANNSSLSDSYFAVATHSPTIDHVSYIGEL